MIPHSQNSNVDLLANVASKLIPSNVIHPDAFSIELIFRPLVLDNITNWCVFDEDEQIINFIHLEDTFKDSILDEEQHEQSLNYTIQGDQKILENIIPKPIVKITKFYDL